MELKEITNNKIMLPDYDNSILNLITSILKSYNVKSKYSSLKVIDKYLKNKYKNVVLVILDGMGDNIIKNASVNGMLYKNKIANITSVFPSTTTAAMTTYYSAMPPIETGWIAWSQYFKEYGRAIDMLPCKDSYTGEKYNSKSLDINELMKYKTVYEQIKEASPNTKTYEIMPDYCEKKTDVAICTNNIIGICDSIVSLCKNDEQKFIMAYSDNPDGIIHKYGCCSLQTREFILNTEQQLSKMISKLTNTDTLVIVSADHGHNDIKDKYKIIELSQLQECLIMPASLESRVLSFFVKDNMKKEFVERFNKLFKDKFILFTKEEFLKSNLLGFGIKHKKIDDFIGDYIAVSISDASIGLGTHISKESHEKVSTHCGLTKNEMDVPVIVFDCK